MTEPRSVICAHCRRRILTREFGVYFDDGHAVHVRCWRPATSAGDRPHESEIWPSSDDDDTERRPRAR